MNPIIDAALRYARMGWPVVCAEGKNPNVLGAKWQEKATSDEATILRWYAELFRANNVGVMTGVKSWVFDIDKKHGGLETLEDLEEQYGRLPDTLRLITGGGGYQIHFAIPSDFVVHSIGQSKMWKGTEVKGWHGFCVLPPSIHPDTGNTYEWDGMDEIESQPILPAPAWLLSVVRQGGIVTKANGGHEAPKVIQVGSQHNELMSLAGLLRHKGLGVKEMFAALRAFADERAEVPASDEYIMERCESAMGWEPSNAKAMAAVAARQYQQEVITTVIQEGKPFADPSYKQPGGKLMLDSKGKPESSEYNIKKALEYAPHWHGKLAFNEFTLQVHAGEALCAGAIPAGQIIKDNEIFEIQCFLQGMDGVHMNKSAVFDATVNIAMANGSHPVRNYLSSLEWDGIARCSYFLTRYMGTDQSNYTSQVGRKWLISAVARILKPGCKADVCLILEGDQGKLKSTAMRALAGDDWFTDSFGDINNKDTLMSLRGKWIVEIAEIDRIFIRESSDIKQFISKQSDVFRPPYGRIASEFQREFIFVGTTNHEDYLKDETGARRFWPVVTDLIDVEAIRADRDQLWAEAVALYHAGEEWWLTDLAVIDEAQRRQRDRYEGDPWDDVVQKYCENHFELGIVRHIYAEDILTGPIGLSVKDLSKPDRNRIGRILKSLGYSRCSVKNSGKVRSAYIPKR